MSDWKECGLRLIEDRSKKNWRNTHPTFNSWALANASRYGKSPANISRILRMVGFYEGISSTFDLPAFSEIPDGVRGTALDAFSRLNRVLLDKDRNYLVQQLKQGDLRPSHTAPFLESYKKAMVEHSTRGRPTSDDAMKPYGKAFQATLDAVALSHLDSSKTLWAKPSRSSCLADCSEVRPLSPELMPDKIWLHSDAKADTHKRVVALVVCEDGTMSQDLLGAYSRVVDNLIVVIEQKLKMACGPFQMVETVPSIEWLGRNYKALLLESKREQSDKTKSFISGLLALMPRKP